MMGCLCGCWIIVLLQESCNLLVLYDVLLLVLWLHVVLLLLVIYCLLLSFAIDFRWW